MPGAPETPPSPPYEAYSPPAQRQRLEKEVPEGGRLLSFEGAGAGPSRPAGDSAAQPPSSGDTPVICLSFEETEESGDCGLDALAISLRCRGVDVPRPPAEIIRQMRVSLRAETVKFLREDPTLVTDELAYGRLMVFESKAKEQAEVERYLMVMSKGGTWIGTPEITAFTLIHQCPVEITTPGGGRTVIGAQFPAASTLRILYHHAGTHFSALVQRRELPIVPVPEDEVVCARRASPVRPAAAAELMRTTRYSASGCPLSARPDQNWRTMRSGSLLTARTMMKIRAATMMTSRLICWGRTPSFPQRAWLPACCRRWASR